MANSLRLLSLDPEIQGYLAKSLLSAGHAKVLLGIEDAGHRLVLARRVIAEGLSVRGTEKLVQSSRGSGAPKPRSSRRKGASPADAATVEGIEKKLTSHLGARVVDGAIHHVTYRDAAGTIQDLWFEGGWQVQPLNLGFATAAPAAASDPVTLAPPSNWEYVAYVDIQGEVQLLSRAPGQPWRVGPLERLRRFGAQ